MKLSDFKFDVPENLIAQYPVDKRDESRLMIIDRSKEASQHKVFKDVIEYLNEGDALVVNETKVFPARLFGVKEKTDARVEILLLRQLEHTMWEVLVKPARKVRVGNRIQITDEFGCDVIDNTTSGGRVVKFDYNGNDFFKIIDEVGMSPLPPYIHRDPDEVDRIKYQTVYAKKVGAVAAPTAGLHFTDELIEKLKSKGIKIIPVVLHVGLGTFRPIKVEDLSRHQMDSEYYEISEESAAKINEVKLNGGRIIAVGTTSVRVLETAANADNLVKPSSGWTDKFIYPPYHFKIIDSLITNFHLSGSTLFLLTCAMAGKDRMLKTYKEAIEMQYRFYSYGDSMMII
ncbi:MAG: tRNA preQ1(34) S-adenosylmethionine ribosyltransferase-isomerase QueA [Calditrichaceae bacterium]|nr:tRNA preQ1(34) S-adenosylmethionine ribosyltransferase-isomerase QueA [Calditrichaceae bacterium]MBN2709942.1 tRNA preQ1(34) S-adenosylmethionine ribosyltransferase-isomerase QueA [Calditrichaceae bacterium]RQV92692.1 MAG: tRNA preQ1(34) S-adenosylmethionine ribosyltransferase-isomerase QueA [Calditrichota bacterium]